LNAQGVGVVTQTEIHTAEPFVPEPNTCKAEVAVWKGVSHQVLIRFQQIQVVGGGKTLHSEIHKLFKLIWNKEKLPHQWKESIVLPVHKKGDKTDCSNYRVMSLLPTAYKILSNILLSRLIPYEN
jgi:hypothetical protein